MPYVFLSFFLLLAPGAVAYWWVEGLGHYDNPITPEQPQGLVYVIKENGYECIGLRGRKEVTCTKVINEKE